MKEQSSVPAMRFPLFSDNWEKEKLGKFIEEYKKKSIHENQYEVMTSARSGLVLQKEYYDNERITERDNTGFNILPPNYITYRSRSDDRKFFFNINVLGTTGIISTYYPVFKIIDGSNKFFTELLSVHTHFIGKHSVGTSQTVLSMNELKKIKLPIPSLPEQEKIAAFLGAVDEKITQLSKKKELLEEYKKGMMQKIFSQEIRFKDDKGHNFPDWEMKSFNKIFERVTRKNKENNKNVMTISAQQGLINQEEYFNKSVSASNVTGYYLLNKGEFAYNKSYSKGYPMGAIKRLNRYEKGVVSTLYICFEIIGNNIGEFYEHFFDSGNQNRAIHKIAQEGARNHGLLNISVVEFFRDIKIPKPHPDEQKRIADFLSSLDQKINATDKQLKAAQDFKKGLLQQMFV